MATDAKKQAYEVLVTDRKACRRCAGLENPAVVEGGQYDSAHIGPWSRWQGNLAARLMIVGQDWGDTRYFRQYAGREGPRNPTNENLRKLVQSIGIDISPPEHRQESGVVFLTNAILCLKAGGLQGPVKRDWFRNCYGFLRAEIALIRPAVVVGLGQLAYESVLNAFGIPPAAFRAAVEAPEGIRLPTGAIALAVYHCGSRILNTHRGFAAQLQDWRRVAAALRHSAINGGAE
jgi:DNA polymerase